MIGSLWSFANFTFMLHIFINGIMRRNWTIFIKSVVHKFLWILKVIRSYKHWLLDVSSFALIVFIVLCKFILGILSILIFSISFLCEFLYQLSFIFLQKVYKLLTFLMIFLLFCWWFLFLYKFFEILCWLVAIFF